MQILKDIRCHPALKHIRIVMTSGINVSEECMKGGANAFIAKPYMPDRLLDLLKEVMEADSGQQISITPGANTTSEGRMAKFL